MSNISPKVNFIVSPSCFGNLSVVKYAVATSFIVFTLSPNILSYNGFNFSSNVSVKASDMLSFIVSFNPALVGNSHSNKNINSIIKINPIKNLFI